MTFVAVLSWMSAFGPKQTFLIASQTSAFGGEVDIFSFKKFILDDGTDWVSEGRLMTDIGHAAFLHSEDGPIVCPTAYPAAVSW